MAVEHFYQGDACGKPESWAGTIALTDPLEGQLFCGWTPIGGGGITMCRPEKDFHILNSSENGFQYGASCTKMLAGDG